MLNISNDHLKLTRSKYATTSASAESPSWEALISQKNELFALLT